jgi:hypothetical protein
MNGFAIEREATVAHAVLVHLSKREARGNTQGR